jgi:hypothetical protein
MVASATGNGEMKRCVSVSMSIGPGCNVVIVVVTLDLALFTMLVRLDSANPSYIS